MFVYSFFVFLMLAPVSLQLFELHMGHAAFYAWLGFNFSHANSAQYIQLLIIFLIRPYSALYYYYSKSNHGLVKEKYEAASLRLTFVLSRPEDQKRIYEPLYSDWQIELEDAAASGSLFEIYKVNLFYGSIFAWRIWRELAIVKGLKMWSFRERRLRSLH